MLCLAQVKYLLKHTFRKSDKEFGELTGNKLGLGKEKLVSIYYDRMEKETLEKQDKQEQIETKSVSNPDVLSEGSVNPTNVTG